MKYKLCLLIMAISSTRLLAQKLNSVAQINETDTVVNASIKGVWQSIGDGYILDAGSGKIILYSYTSNHCYKEKNDYLTRLLHTSASFDINGQKDTITIYLHDFADRTKNDKRVNCRS